MSIFALCTVSSVCFVWCVLKSRCILFQSQCCSKDLLPATQPWRVLTAHLPQACKGDGAAHWEGPAGNCPFPTAAHEPGSLRQGQNTIVGLQVTGGPQTYPGGHVVQCRNVASLRFTPEATITPSVGPTLKHCFEPKESAGPPRQPPHRARRGHWSSPPGQMALWVTVQGQVMSNSKATDVQFKATLPTLKNALFHSFYFLKS